MLSQGTRLFAAACAFACLAAPALAQSSFGPDRAFSTNGMARTMLTVPAGDTGTRSLTIEYAGDLSDPGEVVAVMVEGHHVGTLTGGAADCAASNAQTIEIDAATYETAAADGWVAITFDASRATTPVEAVCGTATAYTGGFAGLNDGLGSSFAVQGTLAARTAPATPVTRQATEAATRGTLALTYGPDRSRRIAVLNGAPRDQSVTVGGLALIDDSPIALDLGARTLSFAASGGDDGLRFWAEGRVIGIDDAATRDQLYGVLHSGVETILGDSTLIGLGLTLDQLRGTDIASGDDSTSNGWMIGPALTHQFAGDLFLDARAAWGRVDTEITRAAGGTDRYDADRTLFDLALVGQTEIGGFTFEPRAAYGWYRERADSYVATGFGPVDGTTTTVHQGTLGARFSTDLDTGNGALMPFLDLSTAFADISGGAVITGSAADAFDGWSGQMSLGADYAGDTGTVWSAEVGLGGLGTDAQTLTGRISLSIPF